MGYLKNIFLFKTGLECYNDYLLMEEMSKVGKKKNRGLLINPFMPIGANLHQVYQVPFVTSSCLTC